MLVIFTAEDQPAAVLERMFGVFRTEARRGPSREALGAS
jgi:hypothetical protein